MPWISDTGLSSRAEFEAQARLKVNLMQTFGVIMELKTEPVKSNVAMRNYETSFPYIVV